jgi:2-methylcitrate dehydratase PrpD
MKVPTGFINRRRVLVGGMGVGAAALGVSWRSNAWAAEPVSPLMAKFTDYMAAAAGRALPEPVAIKTKAHILDTIAAMVSGVELQPAKIALAYAKAHAGDRVATVVGSNLLCGAVEGAMVNGMLAHSDETDDSHAPSHTHPGAGVVPAALAMGEQAGCTGERMMRAVALGYDVGPRVTMVLGALAYQMETQHSTHSMGGDFGAVAAAACVAGLNAQQMRWALDYASQQAAGITAWQRDTEHVEKSLVFGGWPARNGVTAAQLIQLGGSGVEDVFAGPGNFFAAFKPKQSAELLVDRLGERYEVMRTSVKKWTVGSPIQAPLDAMEAMRKKRPFEAAQVKHVAVRVAASEANTVNNRDMPDICLQHMMVVMLLDKTASFAAAHDKPRMKDPAVLRERAKIELIFDEDLEKLVPARVAIVEVTLMDGTVLRERVDAVRGSADNPMPWDEVAAKARDLMSPFLGASQTAALIATVKELERIANVRELRKVLQRGA